MSMTTSAPADAVRSSAQTNVAALTLILRFHDIAADPAQIHHRYGGAEFGAAEILRCAKELRLKARPLTTDWARLAKTPLPALAQGHDGRFFVLGRIVDDKLLIQDPDAGRPQLLPRAEFEARWSGRLILIARRAKLGDLAREFNIGWFLQAIHKYRAILGEVLVASFFLQVFALVTPLFFQVVIDKVLVHRGLTTLDVLIIGFITVACSRPCSGRCVPTCSRTPPTASTSSSAPGFIAT
jgi:subfamily B ATP-binding cassette protein HlyB/CyaB